MRRSRGLRLFFCFLCLPGFFCYAQLAPTRQLPHFDSATVAEVAQGQPTGYFGNWPAGFAPGRVSLPGATLAALIAEAYDLSRFQFDENLPAMPGPGWIENTYYAVEAHASLDATPDEMRLMLQALLADKFKLAVHWQEDAMPAYALTAVNGGPPPAEPPAPGGIPSRQPVLTMPEIAARLSDELRTAVVDQTGLTGSYAWKISPGEFCSSATPPLGQPPSDAEKEQAALPACQAKASIFALLKDRMNLVAAAQTAMPVRHLVIDHVEKPAS